MEQDPPVLPVAWEQINDVWYNYVKGHNPYDYFGVYDVVRWDTFWLDKSDSDWGALPAPHVCCSATWQSRPFMALRTSVVRCCVRGTSNGLLAARAHCL